MVGDHITGIGAGGSINRVQQDDESNCGYVQSFALLVVITGIIIGFIGLASDNDTMVIIGFISFCLPFVLWFLSFVIVILGALLKVVMFGVSSIARGMDDDGYLNIVNGLIIILASLLEILALGDIVLNCTDMWDVPILFFSLIFSMVFVGMIMSMLLSFLSAVKMRCLKRWGVILMATVHKRRRHHSENDDGVGTYTHEVLVSYEVEASHWSCWRPFRYHAVAPPSTEEVSTGEEETNGALQIYAGRPVQPRLELTKTDDNATWSSKRCIQTWLSVNESQYNSSNNSLEVAALTSWPQVAVSTEMLSHQFREHIIKFGFLTVCTAFCSIPGVFMPKKMFFGDELYSYNSWHVKASYILISMFPCLLVLVFVTKESGSHDPTESSQELPSVPQSDTETVATDDDIESDLHSEEENSLPRIT